MKTMNKSGLEKNSRLGRLALLGVAVAGALALGGCTSLPQAGLIYASHVSVGLGLEAGVAPDPATKQGLKLHVGYDQSDVAYVPVAVSACVSGGACINPKLKEIKGRNKVRDSELDPDEKGEADTKKGDDKDKDGGKKNNKVDAYSVFGTFAADTTLSGGAGGTTAPSGNAVLGVGKLFSTGVASQNLTEGMRDYFTGGATSSANCLVIGMKYIDAYKNTSPAPGADDIKAMMKEISATCNALATKAK